MIKREVFFLSVIVTASLTLSSLWACDPNEKIRKINSPAPATRAENFPTPNIYYGGWGFPRSVEVSNYDGDCFPWISGNGKYLLFASINFNGPPRPGHQGVWDIYRSEWNDTTQCWGTPINMGTGINTGLDERRPCCNFNCDTIYFHRIGLSGDADIFMSYWNGDHWTDAESLPAPVNLPFPSNEEHPALSADGMRLYFTSDREAGGYGGRDIWVALWNGSAWDSVVNLGPPINTPNEETRPFESYDGQRLYFTNQHAQPRPEGCYGGWGDIYVAFWTGSGWDNVSVVAAPVNSDLVACSPCESPDGNQLYFGSEAYEGARGDEDIWVAERGVLWYPDTTHGYGDWVKMGELDKAIFVYDLKEKPEGTIYAATACADTIPMGKVFKTTNSGTTWSPCGDLPGAMIVYSLLMIEDTIYAGTYPNGDVFKSINGGDSWVNTQDLPGVTSIRALVQLQNGDILIGTAPHDATDHNRIYRTTNGGITWTERASLTGINPCKFLYQASSGTLFAGGWGKDSYIFIHRSTNNGADWDSITVIPHWECDWSADAFYEASDSSLYVMGWYPAQTVGTGGGFVYRSTDDGMSWDTCSKIIRGDSVHNCRVYTMTDDASGTIYVGMQPAYDSVVFASSNNGDSWYSTGGLDGAFECLCLLQTSDGMIYAGTTPNGDVFKYDPTGIAGNSGCYPPDALFLEVYPNPFTTETDIRYQIPNNSIADLKIYDIAGRIVRQFDYKTIRLSEHVVWNGRDRFAQKVPCGVYFCELKTGLKNQVKKIIFSH
jgi:hypothetical protein